MTVDAHIPAMEYDLLEVGTQYNFFSHHLVYHIMQQIKTTNKTEKSLCTRHSYSSFTTTSPISTFQAKRLLPHPSFIFLEKLSKPAREL